MTNLVKKALWALAVIFSQTLTAQQTMSDGMAAMQMEDWDKAISIYSAIGNNQQAMLALGNAHLAKGDKSKALETFKKAFDSNPEGGAFAYIALGRVKLLENDAAEADKQFARAAKAGKKDVDALRSIGESYLYGPTRNLTRTEELLKNAYEAKTKDFTTLMMLGYCYKEVPNGGLAIQHYEFAEAVQPTNPLVQYMIARCYLQAKIYDKYKDKLEAAAALDNGFTPALREIAEYWYFRKRNYVEALKALEELTTKGREVKVEDEMLLANAYFLNKKFKECSETVDKVMKKDNSKNYLRRLQGYCLYETGQPQKALEVLSDYFKNAPAPTTQNGVVKLEKEGGVYVIPNVKVNGVPMRMIYDTGASSLSLSLLEAKQMWKHGQLVADDFVGVAPYKIANGEIAEGYKVIIKEVEFNGIKISNAEALIVASNNAPVLMGQSILEKLGKTQFDPQMQTLTIVNAIKKLSILASDYEYIAKSRVASKGDTAQAISEFRKAVEIDPTTWANYKDISSLYTAQKNYCGAGPALQFYLDSVAYTGGKPEAMDYYRLGTSNYFCRDDSMRYEKAFAAYSKVTELIPTAAIGWLWAGKSAAKLDPDMSTETDNGEVYMKKIAEFGKAKTYFEKYVEIASVDVAKNKKDLVSALEYLTYLHYTKADVAAYQAASAKLLEIDPANETGLGFQKEFTDNGSTIKPYTPTAPAAPKTPAKTGGGGPKQ